jgi:nitroreductase
MDSPEKYKSFLNLVEGRYSCRAFLSTPITRQDIVAIIEAARQAPSACNRQPWRFIVVSDAETKAKIFAAYPREWMTTAPTLIVACGVHTEAWHRASDGKDHTDIDIAIASEHICLAATALGIGSCWVCNFDTEIVRNALSIPDGIEPIVIIPIGYPDSDSHMHTKQRKSVDDIIQWEKF